MKEQSVTVTKDGRVKIEFPEAFKVPEDWKSLNKDLRNLNEQEGIDLVIKPVEGQVAEDINFSWSIEDFTEKAITFSLIFDNPPKINSEDEPNKLNITFWAAEKFTRESDSVPI